MWRRCSHGCASSGRRRGEEAALRERYRVGGENFVSRDITLVSDFVAGTGGTAENFGVLPEDPQRWTRLQFRSNNSTSRAFILALAARQPRGLMTGGAIDAAQALSRYDKKEFHHIHPTAFLKREKTPGQHNSLANICMLPAAENNKISDSDPRKYLPACIAGLGAQADQVFRSNFLPSPAELSYGTATFEEFTNARSVLLSGCIARLCAGDKP